MLINPQNLPTGQGVLGFFLDSMDTVGWASSQPRIMKHPLLEGWKMIQFTGEVEGHRLRFIDQWGDEGGNTKIELCLLQDPIVYLTLWYMAYEGSYEPEALPFLRRVLNRAYTDRIFFAGRGHPRVRDGDLVYMNEIHGGSRGNLFSKFYCCEEVCRWKEGSPRSERHVFGRHYCSGGTVVPLR